MILGEVERGSMWLEDSSREILREAVWGHDATHRLTGCSWGKGCFRSPSGHLVRTELGAQRSGSHTEKEHWILSQRYVCPSPHFATEKRVTLGKFFSKKRLY